MLGIIETVKKWFIKEEKEEVFIDPLEYRIRDLFNKIKIRHTDNYEDANFKIEYAAALDMKEYQQTLFVKFNSKQGLVNLCLRATDIYYNHGYMGTQYLFKYSKNQQGIFDVYINEKHEIKKENYKDITEEQIDLAILEIEEYLK